MLFDSVHLFKSNSNNWLNQKNEERSFIFPHFENNDLILSANIGGLKHIHGKECHTTGKLAPALSQKVLHLSSMERQNVSLAVPLFDEKNIAAPNIIQKDNVGTAEVFKNNFIIVENCKCAQLQGRNSLEGST
nr:unnamed protein product [Callosobruchus analis]